MCEFCEKYDFSRARVDIRKDTANIELALCNTKFKKEQQFKYCPICGEKLDNLCATIDRNTVIKALKCCGNQMYSCKDKQCRAKTLGEVIDFINQQDAEIERLKSMNQAKLDTIHDLREELEKIKAEEVKEFAERYEERIKALPTVNTFAFGKSIPLAVVLDLIDAVLKEKVGEE